MSESTRVETENRLARDLRVRLVCEVGILSRQIKVINQQTSVMHTEINDFDKTKRTFLDALLAEYANYLENGASGSAPMNVEEQYKQFVVKAEREIEKTKAVLTKKLQKTTNLKQAADEALAQVSRDVLAEKYGRGELILTPNGLHRIIGRIIELNEPTDPAMGIILGDSKKCKASMSEIVWMCENSNQHPPLFFVDIELMPLNEDELSTISWENQDYNFLIKNIPEDKIVWQVGTIFRVDKNSLHEIYVIPYDEENINIVKVEKCEYPNWKAEVLGKAIRNKENLHKLVNWGGYNKIPVEVEDASKDYNVLLSRMERYLSKQYPGIILEMPQWEGERFSYSH